MKQNPVPQIVTVVLNLSVMLDAEFVTNLVLLIVTAVKTKSVIHGDAPAVQRGNSQ